MAALGRTPANYEFVPDDSDPAGSINEYHWEMRRWARCETLCREGKTDYIVNREGISYKQFRILKDQYRLNRSTGSTASENRRWKAISRNCSKSWAGRFFKVPVQRLPLLAPALTRQVKHILKGRRFPRIFNEAIPAGGATEPSVLFHYGVAPFPRS